MSPSTSSTPTPATAPLIYINAFPGTGKLTSARALVSRLTTQNIPTLLLDNHTLIDPVAARFDRAHPEYLYERRKERERAFEKYVEGDEWAGSVVVCTDFRADGDEDDGVAGEYQRAAQRAGRLFVPVCLTCEADENLRRVVSDERKCGGTTKLLDPEEVRSMRGRYELYRFDVAEELMHDVTKMSAESTSLIILRWMMEVGRGQAPQQDRRDIH